MLGEIALKRGLGQCADLTYGGVGEKKGGWCF